MIKKSGQKVVKKVVNNDQKSRQKSGPKVVRKWSKMWSKCSQHGHILPKKWGKNGQKMDQKSIKFPNWLEIGKKYETVS